MLVRYKVCNFLSFYEEQEFSMITGRSKSHQDHIFTNKTLSILKGSYLYGANASGKSNLIKSIAFAKNCILKGPQEVDTIEKHYKLNANSLKKASEFEFEILIENKIYAYGFSLMLETKQIIEEWLYEVLEASDKLIFNRKIIDNKIKIDENFNISELDRIKLEVYIDDLNHTELLLEVLNKKKWESQDYSFLEVSNWFRYNLILIFPDTSHLVTEYFESSINWLNYLDVLDTGINKIIFKSRDIKEIPFPEEIKKEISNDIAKLIANATSTNKANIPKIIVNSNNNFIKFYLKNNELKAEEIIFKHDCPHLDVEFKFNEESDGTKRLLELVPLLEKIKCNNHTIFIDELERSLHPVLVTEFLNIFYKNMIKTNSQLILSTHESRLLDLNKIRRDEIWFLEKNIKKGTRLYSLEEFKTRFDTKIDKAYLLGRYGGIPNIKKIFDDSYECDN